MVAKQNGADRLADFRPDRRIGSLRIEIDSDLDVIRRSSGEITNPKTLRSPGLQPEPGGLFCERIFGPVRSGQCGCGKTKAPQEQGTRCPECQVEPIDSEARRRRLGHIALASPVCHIWHYRGHGSHLALLTDLNWTRLDRIVHYLTDLVVGLEPDTTDRLVQNLPKGSRLAKLAQTLGIGSPVSLPDAADLRALGPTGLTIESGAKALESIVKQFDPERAEAETRETLEELSESKRAQAIRKIRLARAIRAGDLRPTDMIIRVLPVLPPDLRPIMKMRSGALAGSDLNDLYRKIVSRNIRLVNLAERHAPDIILRNEQRLLQNAVDALFDNATLPNPAESVGQRQLRSLTDQLKGKKGRFRQNLLGKRVDYSGRAVIVSGPDLALGQCGLPYPMAAELYRPFVINALIRSGNAKTAREAARISRNYRDPAVKAALELIASERTVVLNRAPSLHRLSMQAFNPVLHEEKAIRLHPLSCGGFNADFDGDQMAAHAPLGQRALAETKIRMRGSVNLLSPASGKPAALPSLDMSLGLYHMTRLAQTETNGQKAREPRLYLGHDQALLAHQAGALGLREPIRIAGLAEPTSCGRILFNRALPPGTTFINEEATKKIIEKAIRSRMDRQPEDTDQIAQSLDDLKDLGFRYAFLSGSSIGMSDMITPPQKTAIVSEASDKIDRIDQLYQSGLMTEQERYEQTIKVWEQAGDDLTEIVENTMPSLGDVYLMASSGAKGNISNIKQMVGMRGLMSDPSGRTIERPVLSNFSEGLSVLEYFISTHGARKGLADTALRTSDAGYLTRRLVDATHALYIAEQDCQTDRGLELDPADLPDGVSMGEKLERRTLARQLILYSGNSVPAGVQIGQALAERIDREQPAGIATIRSPLLCRSQLGVCATCYGSALTTLMPPPIGYPAGILAAQSVGEPGTQLTMRTFHRGGIAGSDITGGLPRVEEILEARAPRLEALLAPEDGTVVRIDPESAELDLAGVRKTYRLPWPGARFVVQKGQALKAGQPLTTGSANLTELLRLAGPQTVWRYMISEIQQIYSGQGVELADKHLEIIISRMFQRGKVLDPGDTDLLTGEIADRLEIGRANQAARLAGKQPATAEPIITGITSAALAADGFLSAASFQNTSTILAEAAALRKQDRLAGLKENVILGQTVPEFYRARSDQSSNQ